MPRPIKHWETKQVAPLDSTRTLEAPGAPPIPGSAGPRCLRTMTSRIFPPPPVSVSSYNNLVAPPSCAIFATQVSAPDGLTDRDREPPAYSSLSHFLRPMAHLVDLDVPKNAARIDLYINAPSSPFLPPTQLAASALLRPSPPRRLDPSSRPSLPAPEP